MSLHQETLNGHHHAADSNQRLVADAFRETGGDLSVEFALRASTVEALLAIDVNLTRIADALEAIASKP